MRKSILYKLTASIVLVSAIAVSSTSVSAQRRSNQNNKQLYEEPNKSTRLRDSDRKEKYNKSSYSNRSNHTCNAASKKYKRQNTHYKNDRSNKGSSSHIRHADAYNYKKHRSHNQGSYVRKSYYSSGDRYRSYRYAKSVHPHHSYKHFYNDHGHNCYRHNRYGNVVLRFAVAPLVIRHTYGDYFYSDGDYYRFYPEVGYVRVDAPNSLYFSYVPDNCQRVSHRGGEYYTNGDMCFVKSRRGFRLVNTPSGIHLSVRF
ncbi:MAG: hypothetical protein JKX79_06490 [Labilibaculum sp.]|nr:hypothetical protein [Labilibaculum sp.]